MTQILFGKNVIQEVLKANRRKIHEIYLQGTQTKLDDPLLENLIRKYHVPLKNIDRNKLDSLTQQARHQGIAAKVDDFPYSSLEEMVSCFQKSALFLICDSITDPQNFGAICRSATCFGVDGILVNKDQSVEVTPVVCKASAGGVEHLSVARVTNLARSLEYLKENGFWSYAAIPQASDSLEKISPSPKMAIVLGSEGKGIRRLIQEKSDFHFSIPMAKNFDSLNVAQAATIILYEIAKKRRSSPSQTP